MKDLETITRENARFLIFSAHPHFEPHAIMSLLVDNEVAFKVMLGSYNGEREVSFLVPIEAYDLIDQAGFLYGQESILLLGEPVQSEVGAGRMATVRLLETGSEMQAGLFHAVDRSEALSPEVSGWTYDPFGSVYYIISNPTI